MTWVAESMEKLSVIMHTILYDHPMLHGWEIEPGVRLAEIKDFLFLCGISAYKKEFCTAIPVFTRSFINAHLEIVTPA